MNEEHEVTVSFSTGAQLVIGSLVGSLLVIAVSLARIAFG